MPAGSTSLPDRSSKHSRASLPHGRKSLVVQTGSQEMAASSCVMVTTEVWRDAALMSCLELNVRRCHWYLYCTNAGKLRNVEALSHLIVRGGSHLSCKSDYTYLSGYKVCMCV